MSKRSQSSNDFLRFPTGRSVKNCRQDAKKLRGQQKQVGKSISIAQALDQIAKANGMNEGWHRAICQLKAEQQSTVGDSNLTAWLASYTGQRKQKQQRYAQTLRQNYARQRHIYLPDGVGSAVRVFPHRDKGLMVTQKTIDLIEADIALLGGLRAVTNVDNNIQLVYQQPADPSLMAHEFHLTAEGMIFYYCRSDPRAGYAADFHARGFETTQCGVREGMIESARHLTDFENHHGALQIQAL